MGLDLVEFVMAVEQEFKLEIPDEAAETFVSPKFVIDYIFSQRKESLTREEVAEKVWQILVYETAIKREDFDENSRFIQDMGID
jgi:acyl carrier protein